LPEAVAVALHVPAVGPFYALVTAVDPASPPILQWDHPDRRNPVTWYTYPSGSPAAQWALKADVWQPVTAITRMPFEWDPAHRGDHHGPGVFFVLAGARDTAHVAGAGLFPELLRAELREVRASIEAYSARASIAGRDEAEGCGIALRKGQTWSTVLRVTRRGGQVLDVKLDRWD
jgi:hypothetical protein